MVLFVRLIFIFIFISEENKIVNIIIRVYGVMLLYNSSVVILYICYFVYVYIICY